MERENKCKQCDCTFIGHHQKVYCDECLALRAKEYDIQRSKKRSEKKRLDLDNNFRNLNPKGLNLLPKHFNLISKYKYQNYHNHFRMTWCDILKRYDKYNELKQVLMDEYKKFYEETGWQGFDRFIPYLEISQQLLDGFDLDEFREYVGVKYFRLTDDELRENFIETCCKIGTIPYKLRDFNKISKVHENTYRKRLNTDKDLLVHMVKEYFKNDEVIDRYVKGKGIADIEKERLRAEAVSNINSRNENEIKESTKQAVELYLKEHNRLPIATEVQELTGITTNIINRKFGMRYKEFIYSLGYSSKDYKFRKIYKEENKVLRSISEILNMDYIPQKTFKWLMGSKTHPLKCDAFFEELSLVVEYDGRQHSEIVAFSNDMEKNIKSFKLTQYNDKLKNELIPQNGLKLLRIAYNEPYEDKEYLKNRLKGVGIKIPEAKSI